MALPRRMRRARIPKPIKPSPPKGKWHQGWYSPKHPEKYVGDISHIRFMSSWELQVHQFLDDNPNVIQWSSETIKIPYLKPTDGNIHYYYPDYWVKYKDRRGNIKEKIVELKPYKKTKPTQARNKRQRIYEQIEYAINLSKWKSAKKICDKYGIPFQIITEKDLLM